MTTVAPEARTFETHKVSLCTDCVALLANGETETVGDSCYWSDLPHDHTHDRGCWNPDDAERQRRESAFVAAVDHNWPAAEGWTLHPGCSDDCGWCHGGRPELPCPLGCDDGERRSSVTVDGADVWYTCPACDGAGFTLGDEYTWDQCEPGFSRSPCDGCGCHLGGDRHNGTAMRETTEDR